MQQIIQQLLQNNFKDFEGARMDLSLPIAQTLIQKIVQENVKNESINWIKVKIGTENKILLTVNLTISIIFKTSFSIEIHLNLADKIPVNNAYQTLADIAAVEVGLGIGKKQVINKLKEEISKHLPPFLRLENDRFKINLKQLLEQYELGFVGNYLHEIKLHTEYKSASPNNKIWIETRASVDVPKP